MQRHCLPSPLAGGITRVSEALEVIDKSARLDATTTAAAAHRANGGGKATESIQLRRVGRGPQARPMSQPAGLSSLPDACPRIISLPNLAALRAHALLQGGGCCDPSGQAAGAQA